MSARIEIETVKKFRVRHEDIFFLCFLFLASIPINGIFLSIAGNSSKSSNVIYIGLIIFNVLLLAAAIFHAWYYYKQRKNEVVYLEDGHIIKELKGRRIFDFPLESIISVRVHNKKGKEGTIVLFTEKESLKYMIVIGLKNTSGGKLSMHGFTDSKISLAKDRKWLLTEIYKVNPKLHFIQSH